MISTIITTCKREPSMVLRALDSILSQTYRDIEIIVIDDSPDEFAKRDDVGKTVKNIIDLHPDIEIQYIRHEKNLGACAARNTGLNAAKGDYIAYLDDDDEWLPEKLEKQIKVMHNSDTALVYCGCYCKNDTTGKMYERKTAYYRGMVFDELLYSNFIASTSFPLLKTTVLRDSGGFDTEMQSAQDYDVWLRISQGYQVDFVAEPLVIYHEHEGEQITSNPLKKISGLKRLNEKYREYLDKDPKLYNIRYLGIAPYYALSGNTQEAMNIWLKAVLRCPSNIKENLRYLKQIVMVKKRTVHGQRKK